MFTIGFLQLIGHNKETETLSVTQLIMWPVVVLKLLKWRTKKSIKNNSVEIELVSTSYVVQRRSSVTWKAEAWTFDLLNCRGSRLEIDGKISFLLILGQDRGACLGNVNSTSYLRVAAKLSTNSLIVTRVDSNSQFEKRKTSQGVWRF